jgi:hypothetical protein
VTNKQWHIKHNWPTAEYAAPKRCQCGRRLPVPQYGTIPELPLSYGSSLGRHTHVWHIRCTCGSILIWSYPNVYKQSHVLELGRTMAEIELPRCFRRATR